MPKYHIELDSEVIETATYEVEADTLEAAIKLAEDHVAEPIKIETHAGDYMGPDKNNCFAIKKGSIHDS